MACVLCQFDPPTKQDKLVEYASWFNEEGLKGILGLEHVQELRVYRNIAGISPVVTAMLFFEDTRSAIRAADSEIWRKLVSNLTRWECTDVTLTMLVPSPVIPEAKRPQ